jgi:xanthine dehydrogenase YagR molybdenum-binding subunit
VKRGVGLAQSVWYRFVSMNSSAEVRVHKDGSLEVLSGVQDIGSGIRTVMAQIVAEQFGVPPEQITVRVGDTNYPAGPDSGGSVTTLSLTPAVRDAAWQAAQKFLADVAPAFGASPEDLEFADGEIRSKSGRLQGIPLKRAASKMTTAQIAVQAKRIPDYDRSKYLTYGGVDVAEVEVDVEVGRIHVTRVLSVHDCGRPMNPMQVISQINGGVIQGVSYTLVENRLLDPSYGLMVNPNLELYKITGSRETPQIEVKLVEAYLGQSSTDASGIGEAAGIVSVGAAIGNAVYNAIGARIRQTPMTPAVVLAALHQPASGRLLA